MLRRKRTGLLILGAFLTGLVAIVVTAFTLSRSALLTTVLSTRVLVAVSVVLLLIALCWSAVIIRTWLLARPRRLRTGQRIVGTAVVAALCLCISTPMALGANLVNSQRNLLNELFPSLGGQAATDALNKPRLNILLVGSDAGPDRRGTRTDTMMVASIDTQTSRTVLFGLPRNIGRAPFPPGSPMARKFPRGFRDPSNPTSGDYLLNAVYAYGQNHPELAPPGPSDDPGLNLLHQTVSYMLGLEIDYYLVVNMAGFAAIIDALGGLVVDVGPEPVPIGGITPSGKRVRPDGWIPAGVQKLNGEQTLAFARSRTDSTDYVRMGRQRCLLQYILQQKSPTDVLTNFQAVARATTDSIATNIPQQVLPHLVTLAGKEGGIALESVSFDPNLPDPSEPDGHFNPNNPNYRYMRQVVEQALNAPPPPPPPADDAPAGDDSGTAPRTPAGTSKSDSSTTHGKAESVAPQSLANSC